MKRVLSIDYGDVRVGVAISDPLLIIAQGLDTIVIDGNDKKLFEQISDLVKKYDIGTIVIGYPKNMNGTKSRKAEKIDSLIKPLQQIVPNVVKWDERLTTVSAYKTMRDLNISQRNKNKYADKLAATYILEGYLRKIQQK